MSNELLVALGGVVLSVLTYFAGVVRTERRLNKQDKRERIETVLSKYLEISQGGKDSGWSCALKAGFATLEDNSEILDVANLIEKHGEKHPLKAKVEINNVDLKKLFTYVAESRLGFRNTPLEQLIEQANA